MKYDFGRIDAQISLGLERMQTLMDRAKNPQTGFYSVLVGGTNGKGSVATLLASLMKEQGHKVGLYTSPHLELATERVKIEGRPVTSEVMERYLGQVDLLSQEAGIEPTPFERFTAAAFMLFSDEAVDWVVAEVGLGGRLDATNVLDADLSVITGVSLDHSQWLGRTLSQVAWEKAGIVKPGRPLVVGRVGGDASRVISDVARKRGAEIHRYGQSYFIRVTKKSLEGVEFFYWSEKIPSGIGGLRINALGEHFAENAATAIKAFELISGDDPMKCQGTIRRTIEKFRMEGRGEVVMVGGWPRILDVAHNPQGMESLCRSLLKVLKGNDPLVLFSLLKDKDWRGITRLLVSAFGCESLLFVELSGEERALEAGRLLNSFDLRVCGKEEMANILLHCEAPVVVCGCFAMVREALSILKAAGVR